MDIHKHKNETSHKCEQASTDREIVVKNIFTLRKCLMGLGNIHTTTNYGQIFIKHIIRKIDYENTTKSLKITEC